MQYQIQAGDSLNAIVMANRTSLARLQQDNPQVDIRQLRPGDTIHVSVGSQPSNQPALVDYPLQPGDTLDSIARQLLHDPARAAELAALNQTVLNEVKTGHGRLEAGDHIKLPAPGYSVPVNGQPQQPQAPQGPAPAEALDSRGITGQGPAVVQEQQQANAWLQSPQGRMWAGSPLGQQVVGATGGQLTVDGKEGPLTRAVVNAMRSGGQIQPQQGIQPAQVNPAQPPMPATPPQVVAQQQQQLNSWLMSPAGQAYAASPKGQRVLGPTGGQLPVTGQLTPQTLAVQHAMLSAELAEVRGQRGLPQQPGGAQPAQLQAQQQPMPAQVQQPLQAQPYLPQPLTANGMDQQPQPYQAYQPQPQPQAYQPQPAAVPLPPMPPPPTYQAVPPVPQPPPPPAAPPQATWPPPAQPYVSPFNNQAYAAPAYNQPAYNQPQPQPAYATPPYVPQSNSQGGFNPLSLIAPIATIATAAIVSNNIQQRRDARRAAEMARQQQWQNAAIQRQQQWQAQRQQLQAQWQAQQAQRQAQWQQQAVVRHVDFHHHR